MTRLIPRIAPRLVLALLPLGIAACQPVYGDLYDSPYGGYPTGVYSDRIYSDQLYDPYAYPRPVYRADGRVFRSAAERDAYLRGLTTAQRRAAREAELLRQRHEAEIAAQRRKARAARQHDRRDHADRDRDRARWEREAAERELRYHERLDRRPVGTDRDDRIDADRRDALFDARRARARQEEAARRAEREQDRLERLRQENAAQERLDRIDRLQARKEARESLARTRSAGDSEVRSLLRYRRQGESAEDFRERVRKAQRTSNRESIPIETLLNPPTRGE